MSCKVVISFNFAQTFCTCVENKMNAVTIWIILYQSFSGKLWNNVIIGAVACRITSLAIVYYVPVCCKQDTHPGSNKYYPKPRPHIHVCLKVNWQYAWSYYGQFAIYKIKLLNITLYTRVLCYTPALWALCAGYIFERLKNRETMAGQSPPTQPCPKSRNSIVLCSILISNFLDIHRIRR